LAPIGLAWQKIVAKHTGRFVAYYRVSTARQGKSGLGLEAQRAGVSDHLNGVNWRLVAEFTEIESGKISDRPKLAEAAIAEHEAKLISDRTRSALAAAKARGKRLGGFRGRPGTAADCAKARQARSASADARAADLVPVIEDIRAAGAKSLGDIARELNARDIPASRGGQWSAAQVRLLLQRLQH
jgi:DNA invertase Pin-like site-specific DNA recombinase